MQAERAMLGEGVAGEVRFGEQAQSGDAAGARELAPLRGAERAEFHLVNNFIEEGAEYARVLQRFRRASERFDDPFDSAHRSPRIKPEACRIQGRICWRGEFACRIQSRIL